MNRWGVGSDGWREQRSNVQSAIFSDPFLGTNTHANTIPYLFVPGTSLHNFCSVTSNIVKYKTMTRRFLGRSIDRSIFESHHSKATRTCSKRLFLIAKIRRYPVVVIIGLIITILLTSLSQYQFVSLTHDIEKC